MTTKQTEILYMNYMKFFGIIYLLLWHDNSRFLNVFATSFFLQMFFFISGYFYNDKYTKDPILFIRKRILTLYIPFVLFCSFFLLCNNFFVKISIYEKSMVLNNQQLIQSFFKILLLQTSQQLSGAMWFVATLFVTNILFCILSYTLFLLIKENYEIIRMFSILFFFTVANYLSSKQITLPATNIDIAFIALFFYYAGYLYKKFEHKIPINMLFAILSTIILILCTDHGMIVINDRQYVNPLFLLTCSGTGVYLNLYISKFLAAKKRFKILNYAGKNTIIILAMHFLCFKLVNLIIILCKELPVTRLADFPFIQNVSEYWSFALVFSGLFFPLLIKYCFDCLRQIFAEKIW